MLAGVWARLAHWRSIFDGDRVLLVPADTHYYLRFAQLQLEAFPRFVSFDPFVNFPEGAFITWPPLHTWLVTLALAVTSPAHWETAMAWVGPAISLVELGLAAWLCRRVLGNAGLWALAILALTPVAVEAGAIGQADHHVHEPMLALVIPLLLLETLKSKSVRWAVATGVVLGAGRMFTSMAFGLIPPVALVFALYLESDRAALKVALVCGASALLTSFLGVAAFGRLGSLVYVDHSAFNPVLVACSFAGALAVAMALHPETRKWALPALAVAVASGALLASEVARALSHLMRKDPLLAWVDESTNLFADLNWPVAMLRLVPLLWVLFCAGLWALWKKGERHVLSVAVMSFCVALAAMSQVRFLQALTGSIAACAAGAAGWETFSPRLKQVAHGVAFFAVATLSVVLLPHGEPEDAFRNLRPMLDWIRQNTPPPGNPPEYAVLGNEDLGHVLNLWAKRPAVASTFSQAPWHVDGNERAHRFYLATDEAGALAAAVATKARYVVTFPMKKDTFGRALHQSEGSEHFRLLYIAPEDAARLFEVVP